MFNSSSPAAGVAWIPHDGPQALTPPPDAGEGWLLQSVFNDPSAPGD